MRKKSLTDSSSFTDVTLIPNIFLDKYLFQADDVYVKIYLFLIRCLDKPEDCFSISRTAELFEITNDKVMDALKYWEKENLISLEYDACNRLIDLSFPMNIFKDDEIDCAYSGREERNFIASSEVLQDLFLYAEILYGFSLNPKEMECMQVWINTYGFSYDLVIYLFELYKGKNIVYLHKIAAEWFQHEVYTVMQAKRYIYNKSYTARIVLDVFGLGDRDLADMELIYIEKWSFILKMPDDLIRIACQRTIQHIHKVSFAYADSILVDWNQKQVKTKKDLDVLDDKYKNSIRKAYKNVAAKKENTAERKSFFNFRQRNYDYTELEKILLNQKEEL